jgi:tRNA(Ile)-lysidine synthase
MKHLPSDAVGHALASSIPSGKVVAAVSGGPDSMAMFHGLCELARSNPGVRVIAAHFDHGLRPDSHADIRTVQCLAARYGVRVISERVDVGAHARASHQSVEAAARELRYAFLERAADEAGADFIATAHTRDDQHETVVMRMMRGTGDRGLRGIHERRGRIVRPLLEVTRAQTVAHCRDHGVPFVDDPSNRDTRFLRNHIRHDVLPALRSEHPELDAVLDEISERARGSYEEAERVAAPRLRHLQQNGPVAWLPFSAFDALGQGDRVHLLMRALDRIGTSNFVARGHYAAMLRMIDERVMGKSVDLPEVRVRCEHDALVFIYRDLVRGAATTSKMLDIPGLTRFGDWILSSSMVRADEARAFLAGPREKSVAYVACEGAFTVRCARPGDRMRPLGMSGRKKLSDLFIDRRVPRRERASVPVIEANGEILWVAGVATGESARIRPGTARVIRVSAMHHGSSA